jgi:hypothetical protein
VEGKIEMRAYLRIERVDLTRDELVRLLGVGVVEEVLLDLLGLRAGHLLRERLITGRLSDTGRVTK